MLALIAYTIFADDISIIIRNRNYNQLIECFLLIFEALLKWLSANKLFLNFSKTHIIEFHSQTTQNVPFHFEINNETINSVLTTKFLGVHLDYDLRWDSHLNILIKQLNSSTYALRRLSALSSQEALLMAYHGLFESKIQYGIIFWGYSNQDTINRLFRTQKRALRIVWGLKHDDSCRELFRSSGILTLVSLLVYHTIIFVFKNKSDFSTLDHNYSTRQKQNLVPNKFRLTLFRNSLFYYGPKFFNCLPNHIKSLTSIASLKRQLRDFLSERAFYSLQEALDEPVPWGQ